MPGPSKRQSVIERVAAVFTERPPPIAPAQLPLKRVRAIETFRVGALVSMKRPPPRPRFKTC